MLACKWSYDSAKWWTKLVGGYLIDIQQAFKANELCKLTQIKYMGSTKTQWEKLRRLLATTRLPPTVEAGIGARIMMNGMLWILRTGALGTPRPTVVRPVEVDFAAFSSRCEQRHPDGVMTVIALPR